MRLWNTNAPSDNKVQNSYFSIKVTVKVTKAVDFGVIRNGN